MLPVELKVSGEFKVFPGRNADVRATMEGVLQEILVKEGDVVQQGTLLAQIDERELRTDLAKIAADIDQKQAQLRMLQAGPRAEEVGLARQELMTANAVQEHSESVYEEAQQVRVGRLAKAENALQSAREKLDHARSEYQRWKELSEAGIASRLQFEDSQADLNLKEKDLAVAQAEFDIARAEDLATERKQIAEARGNSDQAKAKLNLLQAGSRPEQIQSVQAELTRLETQRSYLQEQLTLTRIVSPVNGVVATPKLEDQVGAHVAKGDFITKVFEMDRLRPEISVPEQEVADVRIGQQAEFRAAAYPEKTFPGRIIAIAIERRRRQSRQKNCSRCGRTKSEF
jgi:multidrug resistance efflux pump